MPSNTVIKAWKPVGKEVVINWQDNHLKCQVNAQDKKSLIPLHNIEGIPREILSDKAKLALYLADSHIKLSELSNGNYRLHVFLKLKGGANTFDPEQNPNQLWPNAIIYYEIPEKTFPIVTKNGKINAPPIAKQDRQKVLDAIKAWNEANTGFQFRPRTAESQKDYLIFGEETDRCYSNVGRMGGEQYLRCDLDSGSWHTGNLIHEIGHTVGLNHEHQRSDRNPYITIKSNDTTNYGITGKNHGKYDFDSIMHYRLGQEIELSFTMPQGAKVGQRERLSNGDIAAAKYLAELGKNPDIFKSYAKKLQLSNNSIKAIEYFVIANHVSKTQTGTFDAECFYQIAVEQIKLKQLNKALLTIEQLVKEVPSQNQFYKQAIKLKNKISESTDLNSRLKHSLNIGARRDSFFTPIPQPRQPEWKVIEKKADELLNAKEYNKALSHYAALLNEYAACMDKTIQAKWYNFHGVCAFYQDDFGTALKSFKIANQLDSTNKTYSKNIKTVQKEIANNQYSKKYSHPNM